MELMQNPPLLEVKNLQVNFTLNKNSYSVLRGFSYSLDKAKVLAVVGESGSGKTIHALSILSLLPNSAKVVGGEISYKGTNLLSLSPKELRKIRGAKIAMIFQDPSSSLNPVLTIGEQLTETLLAHEKITLSKAKERAIDLLTKVGIPNPVARLNSYPHQFSGGMCQRVMIAMALALSPDILIADEPTTALDVTIQLQILQLIKKLQQENGMSVIFITHNLALASQIADEILVLYAGLCMEQAPAQEFFTAPKHPYSKGLLATLTSMQTSCEKLPTIEGNPPVADQLVKGCPFAPRCSCVQSKCQETLPDLKRTNQHKIRCFVEEI